MVEVPQTPPEGPRRGGVAVLAVGGNALLPRDEHGSPRQTVQAASRMMQAVVALVREGYRVLVVHGNGPQVGHELLRSEEASTKMPERPLDVCVASTQGTIGYRLGQALHDVLRRAGLNRPVSVMLTRVLVSPADPAFERPTKPIGPFYSEWRARELMRARGWRMVEDAGRGWRRVVPSPLPLDILDGDGIDALLAAGHIVVAGGGGGVPMVVDERGRLSGVEGVVDKDHTAALLAGQVEADLLVFVTPVDHVYLGWGTPEQRALEKLSRHELRELVATGQFPAGSMGPKVEAALHFLDEGGGSAIITSAGRLAAALADRIGTRITREPHEHTVRKQLDLFPTGDPEPPEDEDEAAPSEAP